MDATLKSIFFDPARYPEEAASLSVLPEDHSTCVFGIDLTAPGEGLAALIGARRAGKTTALLPILPEPYEATLANIVQTIGANASEEERNKQLSALRADQLLVNGKRPSEFTVYPPAHLDAAALGVRLADVVLLGAPGERDRWVYLLNRPLRRFALLPTPPANATPAIDNAGITIYAPSTPRVLVAAFATLLARKHLDVQLVTAENAAEPIRYRVVVVPEWRPLRARALAARGHHVVTPNVTRVDECDSRIFGYTAIDLRSMQGATDAALGAPGGAERIAVRPAAVTEAVVRESASLRDGPRVSIIIRTFDRPELLRRAIGSVAAQGYRNVEIVVVNNGGKDIAEVVESAAAGRPFRYEVLPERKHISAASNAGARAATGTYVGYLDDDDLLYADHCARSVDVLERTQADVAFTTCLAEYAQMNGDQKTVLGYQIYLDRDFHPDDIYVANLSPIHTIVHARSLFDRFGYFDEALPVTDDWELWLRVASKGARFVRIDRVTCEYSWRYDPARGNMTIEHQWDFVRAYRTITQRYANDVAGRETIAMAQASMLADQERRANDASDPSKRASVVIGAMSNSVVPVAQVIEP
jgi:hypothetical protein